MEQIDLDVHLRSQIGTRKVKSVRRTDFVPGIVYGGKMEPTVVKVERRTYEGIRRAHHGENIIFRLNVLEGGKKTRDYSAIVKEEQHDPVSDKILHIDFNRISLTEKITVKVGIVAKGDAIGVRRDGGSLEHVLWELDVICLPTQIPQHIEIDVSNLAIGDNIHVKDVKLPEGVTSKHEPEAIILTVVPPMKAEVPAEGAPAAEVEVIKEKKEAAGEKKEGAAAEKKPAEEPKKDKK